MGRPKHHDPAFFIGSEIAAATGMAQRNLQMLRDKRIGPFAKQDQEGGLYSEDTVAEIAMIAGCAGAGYSLTLAAALTKAFLDDNRNHPAARWCFVDYFDRSFVFESSGWFHQYCKVARKAGSDMTERHDQDSVLMVADRQWVLRGTVGKPRLGMASQPGVDPYGPTPLGRMDDLKRGHDPHFTPFWEFVSGPPPKTEDEIGAHMEKYRLIEIDFQTAARSAVALATVNMSLSIRRTFARIVALRQAKGGPFWPEGAA